jgi:hypothetical protein
MYDFFHLVDKMNQRIISCHNFFKHEVLKCTPIYATIFGGLSNVYVFHTKGLGWDHMFIHENMDGFG